MPTEDAEAARDLLMCARLPRSILGAPDMAGKVSPPPRCPLHGSKAGLGQSAPRVAPWAPMGQARAGSTSGAYLRAVEEIEARRAQLDQDLRDYLQVEPGPSRWRGSGASKGSTTTALTIAAELGDVRRFASAPRLMAFVALVPSEH